MPPATRAVIGSIYKGLLPHALARVTFAQTNTTQASGRIQSRNVQRVFTDANGQFTANLWCAEGGVVPRYLCTLPDGSSFSFDLPAGAPITLAELRLASVPPTNGSGSGGSSGGTVGPQGPQGSPGLSAYQIAVAGGYTGTEAQWLLSLRGATGATGPAGPTGPAGTSSIITATAPLILTGSALSIRPATASQTGHATAAQITKLDGIAPGATVNATDAFLRDRANHTGTQPIASVAGLQAALDSKAAVGSGGGGSSSLFIGNTAPADTGLLWYEPAAGETWAFSNGRWRSTTVRDFHSSHTYLVNGTFNEVAGAYHIRPGYQWEFVSAELCIAMGTLSGGQAYQFRWTQRRENWNFGDVFYGSISAQAPGTYFVSVGQLLLPDRGRLRIQWDMLGGATAGGEFTATATLRKIRLPA